jgi:hypothetical protein
MKHKGWASPFPKKRNIRRHCKEHCMEMFLYAILVCGAVKIFYRDVVGLWFYKLELQSNVKYKQKHKDL